MKKDQYIPHDVSLRNTSEVIHLIEKESASGYGLYWAILEYLRTQDNYRGDLRALRGITRQLKSRLDKALRILNDYGLFVVEGNAFYSPLLMEKMQPLEQKRAQRQSHPKPETVKQNEASPSQNEPNPFQNEASPFQASCNPLEINESSDKVKESKEKESITSSSKEEEGDAVDGVASTSVTLAWERYVDQLADEQQWIEIMAMRSGLGLTFVKRFSEVLQHFKRHIQAVGNEKDIQSPSDAKRYFCFYNTPGSKPFRQLVDELHKPADKGKYKYEDRDPATGKRSYCGVPIPDDAPPRPNNQAVWCDGKWVY